MGAPARNGCQTDYTIGKNQLRRVVVLVAHKEEKHLDGFLNGSMRSNEQKV